jgi:hypothetical protein
MKQLAWVQARLLSRASAIVSQSAHQLHRYIRIYGISWLTASEARVQARVKSRGICGGYIQIYSLPWPWNSWPGFKPGSDHVGFVENKVDMGQVSCTYISLHWQSFHRLLHNHHLPSGAGTIGRIAADIPQKSNKTKLQHILDVTV